MPPVVRAGCVCFFFFPGAPMRWSKAAATNLYKLYKLYKISTVIGLPQASSINIIELSLYGALELYIGLQYIASAHLLLL